MTSRHWRVMVVLFVALIVAGPAIAEDDDVAEEPSMNFVTTVDFSNMKKAALEGTAGGVQVTSVEFVASSAKSGGITGAFSSSDTEVDVALTTTIGCAAASDKKWKVDFMVEFLDEDGEVIDRATGSGSLKKDKVFDIKHTTLRWVLTHISKARISVAADQ